MARTPEEIVSDFVQSFLSPTPTATLSLDRPVNRLPRPAASHADWRGLPSLLVSALFRHLPVPDLLRLGYLFTPRWREIWREYPLSLHDRQFTSVPIPRSEVAHAITNVLEEYLDGLEGVPAAASNWRVYSFRVESTEWSAEHAARWCAALTRGGAFEIVVFNRGSSDQPAMLVRVPPGLFDCTSVVILHLGFFTLEPGELEALTLLMDLGLHGCACRGNGVVEGVISALRDMRVLSVHDGVMDTVVVRAAPLLWRLSMRHTISRSLTVDDVPFLLELVPSYTPALAISRLPDLRMLTHLNLPDTTLEIDGLEISVGRQAMEPQLSSVRTLWLALDYMALRGMEEHMVPRVLQQILMCFPGVERLTIERTDDVSQQEGMASREDPHTHGHLDLFGGLDGVAQRLEDLTFLNFQAGKAELALIKALMDRTNELSTLELVYSDRPGIRNATDEVLAALQEFAQVTTNRTLRNRRTFALRNLSIRELEER